VKIVFFASEKRREINLARAFLAGAKSHGFEVERRTSNDVPSTTDYHYACMVGVKSARLWQLMRARNVIPIMFDKGYCRTKSGGGWNYWRVSVGSHNPSDASLSLGYPSDRFFKLGFKVSRSWRSEGKHIVIAGSSAKYHNFHGLMDPSSYARWLVREIRKYSDRPIVYRPKPSWRDAEPIRGTVFSQAGLSLNLDLNNAHALVTHGSNSCFEAALCGVPSIVTGNGVMKSVSSNTIEEIENPLRGLRYPVFHALAYHQWTLAEMESGEAFETIKRQL
jgi:hypothetical protein